jgi:hypothetical protein
MSPPAITSTGKRKVGCRNAALNANVSQLKSPPEQLATPTNQTNAAATTAVTRSRSHTTPSNNSNALSLLASVCEELQLSPAPANTTNELPPFLTQEILCSNDNSPLRVLNLANGKLGITMSTVIVDEGPHVVVTGNGNVLQDDLIFGLNNKDIFGMTTTELTRLLLDQQNDRRELIVLRNKPCSRLKKRRSDGKQQNQWNLNPFISYYALNSDEFKRNNLGLDLYGIITGMWANYSKLPSTSKDRLNVELLKKRNSQKQKADPSRKPHTGKTLFMSLNKFLFHEYHHNKHYKTIANEKFNILSVEDKNAYGAIAKLQNDLKNSYCLRWYKNINEPSANENDLTEGEQTNESADPILPGDANVGKSFSLIIIIYYYSLIL